MSQKRGLGLSLLLALIALFQSCQGSTSPLGSLDLPADQGANEHGFAPAFPDLVTKGLSVGEIPPECLQPTLELSLDRDIRQVPQLTEPQAGIWFRDPVFGTCVRRLSDREADFPEVDPLGGIKNEYARVQAFNADESLLLAYSTEGHWLLYDAGTLQPLQELPLFVEPRWDAADSDLLFTIDGTRLMAYRISTAEMRIVHEFAQDFPDDDLVAVWTRFEGSPSIDGRYWGLMAEDQEWRTVAFLIYDLEENAIIASRRTPDRPEVDSVTISPLGDNFLAFFDQACDEGTPGDVANPCGLMVYDQSLQAGRNLLRVVGHADLALDPAGRQVLVYQDIDADTISMLDLSSGVHTPLLKIDFSHSPLGFHFSGRSVDSPGWALISTYDGAQPPGTWMDDQVFALELLPGGRVVRLAHTRSIAEPGSSSDYWAEPHATVNRDFTRILFTSNWGRSGSDEVELYLLVLPVDWISLIP